MGLGSTSSKICHRHPTRSGKFKIVTVTVYRRYSVSCKAAVFVHLVRSVTNFFLLSIVDIHFEHILSLQILKLQRVILNIATPVDTSVQWLVMFTERYNMEESLAIPLTKRVLMASFDCFTRQLRWRFCSSR